MALLGGWHLAWRATHDMIRAERYLVQRSERRQGVQRVLADAVLLLETGEPASSPDEYVVVITATPQDLQCHVTYTDLGGVDWQVDVREATDVEVASLPSLPLSF